MGIPGNGATTSSRVARLGCAGAEAGTTTAGTAVRRNAMGSRRITGVTSSGFGSPESATGNQQSKPELPPATPQKRNAGVTADLPARIGLVNSRLELSDAHGQFFLAFPEA